MRLDDLLRVMCDEFAQAADDIDTRLLAWFSDGAGAADAQAQAMARELDRVAQTARIISLEGLAVAVEQLRDHTLALPLLDEPSMGVGLSWLAGWRAPFDAAFAAPGNAEAADALIAYLAQGPLAPPDAGGASDETAQALRALLVCVPVLPASAVEENIALPPATAADVSLDVPGDVDRDLYETFLADAPAQVGRLAEAVALLARGSLPPARLQEAQRVAHTFKGSGNIVGVRGVGRLAHRIEDLIEFAAEQGGQLPAAMADDLVQATSTLDQMLFALRGEEEPPADAQQRLQALLDWINAIRADRWEALAQERATARPVAAPVPPPARTPTAAADAEPAVAAALPDAQAQLRIDVAQLDKLVRRAGQDLVRGGRIAEHLRSIDERLVALDLTHRALNQRLAELQVAIDRQGVTLNEKAQAEGGGFDPLEFDRYNHLHTLSRFVSELVADEAEVAATARSEAALLAAAVRDHGVSLKEQHRELIGARMVPFRRAVSRLRRTVSQTASVLGREVELLIEGDGVQLDSDVLDRLTEPLLHLLRNAVDHGIEPVEDRLLLGKPAQGSITLRIRRDGHTVQVSCHDDGRGIDLNAVLAKAIDLGLVPAGQEPDAAAVARLIMLPGFSTRDTVTEVSGRGVGMDVVAERVRAMKGHVDIATEPMLGTTVTLRVPATTGTVHALLVEAGGALFALSTDSVVAAIAAGDATADGTPQAPALLHAGRRYAHARLADWVGLPDSGTDAGLRPAVLVRGAGRTVGLSVDRVVDARELVLQDTGMLLRRARGVAGGAFRTDGQVLFVLDPEQLDGAASHVIAEDAAARLRQRAQVRRQRVLVVDDAISVRKAVAQLVQDAGFEAVTARDGFDALQCLEREKVDLVLTDLEMPNLNGLDFTRLLRQRPDGAAVPVVMITSRSTQKHRDAAEQAGVNLYLTKPYTDADLLAHLRRLIGG